MKKRIVAGFLLVTLLMTGCGANSLIQQYANLDDIKMLDTEQELNAAYREVKAEDQGKWSYRTEKIQEVIELFDKIKKTCENEKAEVRIENIEGDTASARIWAEHARKGMDPQKETLKGLTLYISIKDKETTIATCNKLAQLGFSSFQDYSGNVSAVENGYVLDLTFDEEDYDDFEFWPYSISISVPDVMAFGPERYFDIFDACMENGWSIQRLICEGGAIDGLVINNYYGHGDDDNDCYINVNVLLKDDKVLEIVAYRDEWESGNFFGEEEQKGMVELVARMCDDRNEAVSLLKGLSSGGSKKGSIGDYTWTIEKNAYGFPSSYLFRIQ